MFSRAHWGSRKSSLGPDFCLGQLLARRDWRPWARARAPLVFPLERLVSCWTGSQESCVCLTWRRQLVTGWRNRATCASTFLRGSPSKPVLYGISKFIGSFIFFFRRFKHRKKCGSSIHKAWQCSIKTETNRDFKIRIFVIRSSYWGIVTFTNAFPGRGERTKSPRSYRFLVY